MTGDDDSPVVVLAKQRIDKWLWFTRVVKSRTMAAALVTEGRVRINRERIDKPSVTVTVGDVITVTAHQRVRVLKVLAPGVKRGSALQAATLFDDLTPPPPPLDSIPQIAAAPEREAGSGRPTKRERRELEKFKRGGNP